MKYVVEVLQFSDGSFMGPFLAEDPSTTETIELARIAAQDHANKHFVITRVAPLSKPEGHSFSFMDYKYPI